MNVSGPVFLLLYVLLAVVANLLLRGHYRRRETPATVARLDYASDPYRIACLREGPKAAIHVAVVSLVDRGLLAEERGRVCRSDDAVLGYELRPFEKKVLESCGDWIKPAALEARAAIRDAAADYERQLAGHRLLADDAVFAKRLGAFLLALGVTTAVAIARIVQAVSHGRHNIGFLIVLAIACAVALNVAYRKRRTGLGDAVLTRLATLFARLKREAHRMLPGGRNQDLALLAAVFGLAALPAGSFAFVQRLYPRPKSAGGDGGGGDGGGGCGGGGCGGGGCGGGCGG